ncbi:MAG TPA: hypothetical protein VJL37_10335 [Flavobacterium sp.]|nr:hypothetical protein [Flavobacterium sp.]
MKKLKKEKLSFEKLSVVSLSSPHMRKIMGGLTTEGTDDPDTITGHNNGGNNSSGDC